MAEGVAGVAPGGDGGADEEGFLAEGVVPVVAEVAGPRMKSKKRSALLQSLSLWFSFRCRFR